MSYFNKFGFYDGSSESTNGSSFVLPSTVVQNSGGPSVDNAITRFDGTAGNRVQNSGITITDTNDLSGVATLSTSTLTASTVSASTSISSPSIITSSGNLSLNPSGASISMNSKNLTSIGTITPTTANNAGDILILGSTSPLTSTTPNAINLGTGISSVAGSNLKLKIYDDGLNRLGFGMSNTQLDYVCTSGADSHVFYNGGAERARINQSALRIAVPITTSAGDLSLNPSGSNININSKNLSNVGTGITASAGLTISTSSNAALNLTANGSGNVVIGSTTGSIQLNRPITNASGDLTFNPAGNIAFSNKTLSNAYRIVLNGSTTTLGTHKLRLYDDGSNFYGLGVQNGVLSYELPSGLASHVFYHNAIERVRINDTALQTAVPITTSSGNLVINPAGSSVDFSGKSLINVASINTTTLRAYMSAALINNSIGGIQFPTQTVITGNNSIAANTILQGMTLNFKAWFSLSTSLTSVDVRIHYGAAADIVASCNITAAGSYYWETNITFVAASGAANNVEAIGVVMQNAANPSVIVVPSTFTTINYSSAQLFRYSVAMTTSPSSDFHIRRWLMSVVN